MEEDKEKIRLILQEFGKNVIEDIRANMATYGLGDSELSKSLFPEVVEEDGEFSLRIIANDYWEFAQKGHPPGAKYRDGGVLYGLPSGKNTLSGVPYDFDRIIVDWGKVSSEYSNNVKWQTIRHGSYLYRHPESHRNFVGDAITKNLAKLSEDMKKIVVNAMRKK